eukprot:2193492-Pleurochrysis_carterae.AAC.1
MVRWRTTVSCTRRGEDTVKRTLSSAHARALTVELVQCVELLHTNGNGCDFTGVSQACAVRKQRACTEDKVRRKGAESPFDVSVNALALTAPAAAAAAR